MLKDRRGPRRSFTVEARSGERGSASTIPSRVTSVVGPSPSVKPIPPLLATASRAEKRRILPNLIEPEPTPVGPELQPQRRRGRPRKVPPVVVEPIAEIVAEAEPLSVSRAPEPRPVPVTRIAKPVTALAPGERWKRRLSRWSR